MLPSLDSKLETGNWKLVARLAIIFSMNIIICGSLAYDRIMDFPGYFADHILPEKIHVLNVSFMVNSLVEKFGGTAGNIAYALTLLGERPLISAAIGQDYQRYFAWLKKNAISTDSIKIIENDFTASAYKRAVEFIHDFFGPVRACTDNNAVWIHEVIDGKTFA